MKIERVMERVYDRGRLHRAWQAVERNDGAAGIDQMTVEVFAERAEEYLDLIHAKLQAGSYRFKPVRRVEIPKPGSTKKRKLGIPVVMDRIVSQSLHTVLMELYHGDFTGSNFGFLRGKSQHQAIEHMRQAVVEGYEWCASIDLQGFFDEIPHDLILRLIRRKIRDERVVTLIARALKAGVRVAGKIEKTTKGCPQGAPVSPSLSNIVLNELDQELGRRGHRYCRWADDFVILLRSERAARRVMASTILFLEATLGLPVNRDSGLFASCHLALYLVVCPPSTRLAFGRAWTTRGTGRTWTGSSPRTRPVSASCSACAGRMDSYARPVATPERSGARPAAPFARRAAGGPR